MGSYSTETDTRSDEPKIEPPTRTSMVRGEDAHSPRTRRQQYPAKNRYGKSCFFLLKNLFRFPKLHSIAHSARGNENAYAPMNAIFGVLCAVLAPTLISRRDRYPARRAAGCRQAALPQWFSRTRHRRRTGQGEPPGNND